MAFIQDQIWHRARSISITDKNTLIAVLNDIANNHPALCDVIVTAGPLGNNEVFFVDYYARTLESLVRIASIDENAAAVLAHMNFHTANLGSVNFMPFFEELAEKAPEDFLSFLAHPDVPANITLEMALEDKYPNERTYRVIQNLDGSYRTILAGRAVAEANDIPDNFEDLLLPFLEITDPQAVARVEGLYDPQLESEILRASVIRFGSRLAVYYPHVFAALTRNLGDRYTSGALLEYLYMIAEVDEGIAARLATMPLVAHHPSGPTASRDVEVFLALLGATLIDPAQTHAILDMYEQEKTVAWPDLDGLAIELMALFRPDYATTMKGLPWIQNGISSTTRYRVSQIRGCIGEEERFSEADAIYSLNRSTRRGEIEFVDAILNTDWINDPGFNWLRGAAIYYLKVGIDSVLIRQVTAMPFLATLEARDLTAINWIGQAKPSLYTSSTNALLASFMRLLDHPAIGGEITDENQDRLQEVAYEISDSSYDLSGLPLSTFEKYIFCEDADSTDR